MAAVGKIEKLEIHPLTRQRWTDFETLFGPNGASAGCWCMWWRMTNREFRNAGKEGHKEAMRTAVHSGAEPGLLAYADGVPAGWVAIAPRTDYPRLATLETLYAVDGQEVWSIVCFFIHRNYRRHQIMQPLVEAAVEFARSRGAKIVEAYPLDIHEKVHSGRIYMGITSIYERCGFVEVARRDYRPILRKTL
jgi:GNAT superfamily N-acetyltransferase